jgi:hypothetical protein
MIEDPKNSIFKKAKRFILDKSYENLELLFDSKKSLISQTMINKLFYFTCKLLDDVKSFEEIFYYMLL